MAEAEVPLGKLFFELSHPDRLSILRFLRDSPRRQSELVDLTGTTAPEVDRQLKRLANQSLVLRGPSGRFELTAFGRMLTSELPAFTFLARHREFFLSHDIGCLPLDFAHRFLMIGEVESGDTFTDTLRQAEKTLEEASQYAWFTTDQEMVKADTVVAHADDRSIQVRVIVPPSLLEGSAGSFPSRRLSDRVEVRGVPRVHASLALNEKVGGVCFTGLDGRIDYSQGFRSNSGAFHRWCVDLFEYYWLGGRGRAPPSNGD